MKLIRVLEKHHLIPDIARFQRLMNSLDLENM